MMAPMRGVMRWVGVIWLPLVFLGIPWFLRTGHTPAATYSLINVGLMYFAFAVASLLGEVIVALVARWLGDHPIAIVVGFGPTAVARQVGRSFVRINVLPCLGFTTIATPRQSRQVLRLAIARMVAATVLLTGAVLLVRRYAGVPALRVQLEHGVAVDITFAIAAGIVAAFGLLSILTTDEKLLVPWHRAGLAVEASDLIVRGAYEEALVKCRAATTAHPDDPILQVQLVECLGERQSDEALVLAEKMRARDDLTPSLRASVNNSYAWQLYLANHVELLHVADRASLDALTDLPTSMPIADTRGHILLWARRYTEAEPLLVRSYESRKPQERSGRMSSAAGMAMLCAATDRPDEARTWLARARAEDISHDLVARATAAVEPLSRR